MINDVDIWLFMCTCALSTNESVKSCYVEESGFVAVLNCQNFPVVKDCLLIVIVLTAVIVKTFPNLS